MPHPTAAPTPEAMVSYAHATIARLGADAATPILLGAAQDWDTAGCPNLAAAIRGAIPPTPAPTSVFLLTSVATDDYDTETVLDTGRVFRTWDAALAMAQAECDELAETKTLLSWEGSRARCQARAETTIWQVREVPLGA